MTADAARSWPKEAGACDERGFLEFDHIVPFAAGGDATVENLRLLCRVHNRHEAELFFGPHVVRETPAPYLCTNSQTRSGPSSDSTAQPP